MRMRHVPLGGEQRDAGWMLLVSQLTEAESGGEGVGDGWGGVCEKCFPGHKSQQAGCVWSFIFSWKNH